MNSPDSRCAQQRVRCVMMPDWRSANPYQQLLASALEERGVAVTFTDMPAGIFALNRLPSNVLAADILHLHWIGALIGHVLWSRGPISRSLKLLLLALDVLLIRLRGKRVVWTIHNVVGHESTDPESEIAARRVIARTCNKLIVHSTSALACLEEAYKCRLRHKMAVIPHGNYQGWYSRNPEISHLLRRRFQLTDKDVVLLFFGGVRRYKGVLELVELFSHVSNPDLRLIIAGAPDPAELGEAITVASKNDSRIVALMQRIPDEWVAPLFEISHAAIIPFERTLTSGSTVLAMTFGKPPILPSHARIFDLVDEKSGFIYDDEKALRVCLSGLSQQRLLPMGEAARAIAVRLDWKTIAGAIRRVYGP